MNRRQRGRRLVCQQLVEKVSAYLDNDLDPADRAAVEEHLAGCDACAGYVAQVRRLLELTAAPGPAPLPAGMLDALTRRFSERRAGPPGG